MGVEMFGTISYNATGPSYKKKFLATVECLSQCQGRVGESGP